MPKTFEPFPIAFSVMVKPAGPECNLNCTYCYYLSKEDLFEGKHHRMPPNVLEEFIKQYIAFQSTPVVQFIWHGGEPALCGLEYFETIVALQNKHARGRLIENVLQTNGTLLNDAWGRFLHKNQFLVGISIDGPQSMHDAYRLNHAGRSSFRQVMNGIECLKKFGIEFNTMSVVHPHNARHGKEVYQFLKSIGSHYMQFTPIVEPPAPWTVDPVEYGTFLCDVFDQWVRFDVGTYFVPTFDSVLANWAGEMPSICVWAKTCGHAGVMEHNGEVYACDHFVFPEYRIGNITRINLAAMMYSPGQLQFGANKQQKLPVACRQCAYLFACNGECPKNRFPNSLNQEHGVNYLCAGLRKFFGHIAPYMEFMAQEFKAGRPPMNVLDWKQAPWKIN